jgi:FkbM family methyltransferase
MELANQQAVFRAFYGGFLHAGDLCFDVGANFGNRVRCFRDLGCKVVAVEPQRSCVARLRREFGGDDRVVIVDQAVGRNPGQAELKVSPVHVLSTLSEQFISSTHASGRFAGVTWAGRETVGVTTLDELIREHGIPRFVKIDVEGFEAEVLAGLTVAVPMLSFEWTPELTDNARTCLQHLAGLGSYEYNLSWGESMRFSRAAWRSMDSLLAVLAEFEGESVQFGDIYARIATDGPITVRS